MYSITTRLFASTLLIVISMYSLTGYILYVSHQNALLKSQEKKLLSDTYALIPLIKVVDESHISLTATPVEARLSQRDSGLYALILDNKSRVIWHSASTPESESILFQPTQKGHTRFRHLSSGEFLLAFGLPDNMTIILIESSEHFDTQLSSYTNILGGWLSLLGLITLITALASAKWTLRPLNRATKEINKINAGIQSELSQHYPLEIFPLTDSINSLVKLNGQQVTRYRNTLSELAHSLKTPLAVMRSEIENKTELDRNQLSEQIEQINLSIKYHLNRAAARGPHPGSTSQIVSILIRLTKLFEKAYPKRQFKLVTKLDNSFRWPIDEQDLMEMCGNLIDNAAKWSKSEICIKADVIANELQICIQDDGVGISEKMWPYLLQHGAKGGSYKSETGIGLAVSNEIAKIYSGRLTYQQIESGGSSIYINLPKHKAPKFII